MYVPATDGTAIYIGDPVIKTSAGANAAVVQSGTVSHPIGTLPTVTKATMGATHAVTGVVVAIEAQPLNRDRTYRPASTEAVLLVCDNIDEVFEVQCDAQAAITAANIGLNANLIAGAGGSSATGISSVMVDTSSLAADATYQLTVIGVSGAGGRSDVTATNCVVLVRINLHSETLRTAGI